MNLRTHAAGPAALAASAVLALALGASPGPFSASASVPTDPPAFSDPLDIDNAYHPFVPHRIRLYQQVRGGADAHVIDVFLPQTRTFVLDGADVECAILEEWEIEDGEILEISHNYFAQSDDGTVRYFGEVVDVYEGGEVVGHGGSWLVGGPSPDDPDETLTADAPTVFMPGNPEVGDEWKAEDLPEAGLEEFDTVVRFLKKVVVPAGTFRNVLAVREQTPDVETKDYAPGVGFLRSKSGGEVMALAELIDSDDEEEMLEELDEILEDLLGEDGDGSDDDD